METDLVAREKKNNQKIYWVYIILFFIFLFKMFFYVNENLATPDSKAQLSYVAYMELHPEIWIPDFADVPIYSIERVKDGSGNVIYRLEDIGDACYLGHPPLYYKLMALFDCVSTDVEGNLYLNYTKLRICNILLTAFTMVLIMSIGYKLLKQRNCEWYMHLLFFAVATSLPIYGYIGSGVNNDNLCNLGLVIVWLGLLNYIEKGYSYKTFWLVAIGLALTVFGKLTTGIIALVAVVVMILVDIIKTRKLRIVFNKYFATTIPVYAIVLHYFLSIYAEYGDFDPAYGKYAKEDYLNSIFYVEKGTGETISFIDDIAHHFGGVFQTWCGTYNYSYSLFRSGIYAYAFGIILVLFAIISIVELMSYFKKKGQSNNVVMFAFSAGLMVLLVAHFMNHYKKHSVGGYSGGSQGRYYMSAIPIIAMGATQVIDMIYRKSGIMLQKIGKYLIIAFSIWVVYLDFFYYVQYVYNIL